MIHLLNTMIFPCYVRLPGGNTNSLKLHMNYTAILLSWVVTPGQWIQQQQHLQFFKQQLRLYRQSPKGPRARGSLESFVSTSQILQHLGEELLVILWPHVAQNPRTRWHQLRVDGLAVPAWTETQSGVSYDCHGWHLNPFALVWETLLLHLVAFC